MVNTFLQLIILLHAMRLNNLVGGGENFFYIQSSLVYQTSLVYLTRFFPKRQNARAPKEKPPRYLSVRTSNTLMRAYSGASIPGTFRGPRQVSPEWKCPFNRGYWYKHNTTVEPPFMGHPLDQDYCPLNRGVHSIRVTDTNTQWAFIHGTSSFPECVPWIEVFLK